MTEVRQNGGVYWCRECGVPLLQPACDSCGAKGKRMGADLRPVFEEERRLLEESSGVTLPRQNGLLWMNQRTLWHDGHPHLRFKGTEAQRIPAPRRAGRIAHEKAPATLRDTIAAANKGALRRLEQESLDFTTKVTKQFDRRTAVVSFSGGKDSVVVSHLVRKALGTEAIPHIFGDTNNELPDTYTFIEDFTRDNCSIPMIRGMAERDWLTMSNILGPPSRITAWCCSVFKATALTKAMNSLPGNGGVLSFEGVRRSESSRRRFREAVAMHGKIAAQVLARPILTWRDIDVWLYTLVHDLPINRAYRRGLTRVGCLYCPHHTTRVDRWLESLYPNEMRTWQDFIMEYSRERLGKPDPEEYWASGGWKARVGNNGGISKGHLETRLCYDDESTNYILQRNFAAEEIADFMRPFGHIESTEEAGGTRLLVSRSGLPLFSLWGVDGLPRAKLTVFVAERRHRLITSIARQLRKYQACVRCGVCEGICEHRAISVLAGHEGRYLVDDQRCNHCMDCVEGKRVKGNCVAINTSYGRQRTATGAS